MRDTVRITAALMLVGTSVAGYSSELPAETSGVASVDAVSSPDSLSLASYDLG